MRGRGVLAGIAIISAAATVACADVAAAATDPFKALPVPCASRGFGGTAYRTGANCRFVRIQGYPRRFVVWVPPKAERRMRRGSRVPLVVMLHGTGGTGEKFFRISGWTEKAERLGFVVAYPTGLSYLVTGETPIVHATKWNSFQLPELIDPNDRPPGYPASADFPANDIGFLRRLVADVRKGERIDPRRIYLSGFSNGGEMCSRVGVEASDLFAAVGCSAGTLDDDYATTGGNPHIPMILSVGTRDALLLARVQAIDPSITKIPLDPAQILSTPVLDWTIPDTLDSIGLEQTPFATEVRPTFTQITWHNPLPGNVEGNLFRLLVLDRVGHIYPHGTTLLNPHRFVMADLFWRFFMAHPKH